MEVQAAGIPTRRRRVALVFGILLAVVGVGLFAVTRVVASVSSCGGIAPNRIVDHAPEQGEIAERQP